MPEQPAREPHYDVNELLAGVRDAREDYLSAAGHARQAEAGDALARLFADLDEQLSAGGGPPDAWSSGQAKAGPGPSDAAPQMQDTPGRPLLATGDDGATAVQLAGLAESAALALDQLAAAVPVPGQEGAIPHSLAAAVVVRRLGSVLEHVAGALSSPAVTGALPHAARHLDVAATGIGTAAHLIRTAEPAIRRGKADGGEAAGQDQAAARTAGPEFPDAPAARPGSSPRRRPASTGTASPARPTRPGRPG